MRSGGLRTPFATGTENVGPAEPTFRRGAWIGEEYEPRLVSVVIPTYNRAYIIAEALDSVWGQSYRPIELMVVDDGSTDNTPEILEDWASAHSDDRQFSFRVFRQAKRGAAAARNLGAAMTRGEFILWHDSDDVMLARRVELAVARIRDAGADACICGFQGWGNRYYVPPDTGGCAVRGRHGWDFRCLTIVWLYRRCFLARQEPWREYLVRLQDHFFYNDWSLSLPEPAVASVPDVLVVTRTSADSIGSRCSLTRADFQGRLRYLTDKLAGAGRAANEDELRQFVGAQAATAAVCSRLEFPELSDALMAVWRLSATGAVYGRTWAHRLLWRVAGVSGCALCMRAIHSLRHIASPLARRFTSANRHSARTA